MDEDRKVLPLKEAFKFGLEHGLEKEIAEIRYMEIEWDLPYSSSLRRGYIFDLFATRDLLNNFKEMYWPSGNLPWGQSKSNFWFSLKSRYQDFLAGRNGELPDEESEEDQAFAAETDLRDFLANNLDLVEEGLQLFKQGEMSGVEYPVEEGRIDILATDKDGRFVVFELKLARGRNKALGQLLYFMGWVDKNIGNCPCRGIVVAKDISDDLILASQRIQDVSFYRYRLSMSVERVK